MKTNTNETEKKVTFIYESDKEMKQNRIAQMELATEYQKKGYSVVSTVEKVVRKNNSNSMWENMKKQVANHTTESNFSRDYYNQSEANKYGYRFYHKNSDGSREYMK